VNKLIIFASAVAAFASTAASAATNLVTNGSFEQTTLTSKGTFENHVTGWSGGQKLTFLDTPGSSTSSSGGYAVYAGLPASSPDGGNFVQMDGDSNYNSPIYQLITGLTVGQQYTLTFYQAAGQQQGYTGTTTEQWAVYFQTGTTGTPQLSDKYTLASQTVGAWQKQTMTLTATATSEYLAFLAVGTPAGMPPTSFLDGVSLTAAVPEPATWAMMLVGFGAMGVAARRRRQVLATA
jgi:hypothetical protein